MNKNNLKFYSEGISKFYDLSDVEFSMQLLEKHLGCLELEEEEEFNYVCSVLPLSACKLVKDIILDPPKYYPTKILKMALIERSFSIEVQKPNNKLALEEIYNHKPSIILLRMREVCENVNEEDLLSLYRKFLPTVLHSTIDNLPVYVELDAVAIFADVVYMESINVGVSAMKTIDTNRTDNNKIDINDEQTKLLQKVDLLEFSLLTTLEIMKDYFQTKNNQNENKDVETESLEFQMSNFLTILCKRFGIDL